VSTATISHHLGASSILRFDEKSTSIHQQPGIFNLLRAGYEVLFHLSDEGDAAYFKSRTKGPVFDNVRVNGGIAIGIHVRHGDVHPRERIFKADYLPLTRYMDEAQGLIEQHEEPKPTNLFSRLLAYSNFPYFLSSSKQKADFERQPTTNRSASQFLVASDDPLVFSAPELSSTIRSQERFNLATKADLQKMLSDSKTLSPLDNLHGWDGGFFRSVFLALGRPDYRTAVPPSRASLPGGSVESEEHRRIAAAGVSAASTSRLGSEKIPQTSPVETQSASRKVMEMRTLIGRGYLLDLAVLGQCDAIICGVNSAACRILGVMAGWNKITEGMWKNIDGHGGWIGVNFLQGN
jgi:hypothetical protein